MPWADTNELVPKPVGALPVGSHVCRARFLAFCVCILTSWCNKMFPAHFALTLTQPQVTRISLRRPGTRCFWVLGCTTPWGPEQMERIQLRTGHTVICLCAYSLVVPLPGPLGRHLPSMLSFSTKTDSPSTPQSWPPPLCPHWAIERLSQLGAPQGKTPDSSLTLLCSTQSCHWGLFNDWV